jgi:hypothetical protein
MKNIAVVTGYIMYYDMLKDKINGSFFSKIDRAVEIAELFCSFYSAEEESGWSGDLDFEETLEQFLKENI